MSSYDESISAAQPRAARGTGHMIILPVDQGFEHGPGRSFAPNPPAYDPLLHFQLAIDAGLNAYASLLGFLEAGAAEFAGQVPLILKLNSHDVLHPEQDPLGAQTASVRDALRVHFSSGANITRFGVGNLLEKATCGIQRCHLWANCPLTVISRAGDVEKLGECKSNVFEHHSKGLESRGGNSPPN